LNKDRGDQQQQQRRRKTFILSTAAAAVKMIYFVHSLARSRHQEENENLLVHVLNKSSQFCSLSIDCYASRFLISEQEN
jgi:hypothetical protein